MAELLHELTITLLDIEPPVWRTLVVSPEVKLDRLHLLIQTMMGWEDRHLYEFTTREGSRYGLPDSDDRTILNSQRVALNEVLNTVNEALLYNYDFGDDWLCQMHLDKLIEPDEQLKLKWPICLAGKRSAPPEDCGGPLGYEYWLKQLKSRSARTRREAAEVLGPGFDPEAFDAERVNLGLRRYATRPRHPR